MVNTIYLDNSATTRPYDEVIDYMAKASKENYGNPSSLHKMGSEAERLIKSAREQLGKTLGADEKEIIFTSGGTEANNLAIRGYLEANPRKGRHILTTTIEHPSVLEVFLWMKKNGYTVDYLKVDSKGLIDLEELKEKITEDTALLSIVYTNNEVGTIQRLEDIVKIKNGINKATVLHMDAVQAYGKSHILPKKLGIDMLSMSAHKIHGPKGAGALYVRKGIKLGAMLLGGGQEKALRSGTENVPGILGFGLAATLAHQKLKENNAHVESLKEKMIGCLESFPDVKINSPKTSSPYILNVSFMDVKAQVLLHHLEEKGIFVSTGSACSSRKNKHSYVLKEMQRKDNEMEGAIRFSFSPTNTMKEIEETVKALEEIIPKIKISRGGKK